MRFMPPHLCAPLLVVLGRKLLLPERRCRSTSSKGLEVLAASSPHLHIESSGVGIYTQDRPEKNDGWSSRPADTPLYLCIAVVGVGVGVIGGGGWVEVQVQQLVSYEANKKKGGLQLATSSAFVFVNLIGRHNQPNRPNRPN